MVPFTWSLRLSDTLLLLKLFAFGSSCGMYASRKSQNALPYSTSSLRFTFSNPCVPRGSSEGSTLIWKVCIELSGRIGTPGGMTKYSDRMCSPSALWVNKVQYHPYTISLNRWSASWRSLSASCSLCSSSVGLSSWDIPVNSVSCKERRRGEILCRSLGIGSIGK